MNKLLRFALIAVAASFSAIGAQAMPFSSTQTHDSLVVEVAGGCGLGFHRGPYGGCRRNGYYGGAYYGGGAVVVPGVAVVPPVVVAPACRRVCNPYRCWRVC
jgi:hypothetical protein